MFISLRFIAKAVTVGLLCAAFPMNALAATVPNGDFSLEVSPSPLVAEVKPGESRVLELKIRNASTKIENLKIEVRGFTIAYPSQQITISTTPPADLAQWVSFSHPTFSVDPGEWYEQKITIKLPEKAGFSYPFAVLISRQNDPSHTDGGASLRGSVAVFSLINIDRPGATRKLELESIKTDHSIYEFLPSAITVKLKNTGNSIVQPYGNIYVHRPSKESAPLAVLPVNESRGYLLPGGTKELTSTWADGFPVYKTVAGENGQPKQELDWNWRNLTNIRFGQYSARVVAVYNDGTRDIPVTGEISFWVIPWRILLGLLVVVVVIGFGIWTIIRRLTHHTSRLFKRKSSS